MDDSGPTACIIIFCLLLLVDMFFYGFGTASRFLSMKDIERRLESGKDNKKTLRLKKIVNTPEEYVNTVQLVVTLVNILIGCMVVRKAPTVLSQVLTLFGVLYIILTFGVLLPKKLAARVYEKWSYACITPVYYITLFLKPFTGLVSLTVKAILFLLGIRGGVNEGDVTEEEIINMVNEGHEQGVIQASEAEMISNIFEYGDKEAQDIMTHRKKIIAIDGDTGLRDAIDFMIAEKNSRYPVFEGNIDNIIGILHLKDAMRMDREGYPGDKPVKELGEVLREVYFVPRTKNIDELFQEMQSGKLQMVIVVDEYGQTDGLVAMEDILEEIVGNIMDEYDEDKEYIEDKGNDEYIIEGNMPLEELEERLGIRFEEEEFETLNGFLISKLDRIPEPDQEYEVDYGGYHFKVLSVEHKMIASVRVTHSPLEEQSDL